MPVLIVSENTWPHDGFSRNRSTLPSSSVTTIPNSSGFSTDLSPIVTAAPFSLWNVDDLSQVDVAERVARDDEERLVERVGGEPHGAGRAERALLDRVLDVQPEARAVAEVGADRLRQERDRDDDVLEAVLAEQLEDVLHARLADDRDHRLRLVRGQRPKPRALAARHHDGLHANASRFALIAYSASETNASPRPTQKMTSGHVAPSRRDHHEAERRVQKPRRGLAEQVDLELVAAAHHDRRAHERDEVTRGDQQREPRQAAGVDEQDHRAVDHQPVGERVGDLPERRLDLPAPREVAVDLVGHPGDRRRRSPPATTGRRQQVVISHT